MKQNITWEQLAECKKPGTLLRWMEKRGYNGYRMPPQGEVEPLLPNIGQLIEFLEESGWFNIDGSYQYHIHVDYDGWHVRSEGGDACYAEGELCDSLWEAVKQVLEGEKV